ncbi:MAG: AAA family ATPase [Byssovorax sp.]
MILPLQSIRIENFRGIRAATLELHPEVTVLFGANAAGKTTMLDALAIALGALVARVPKAAGRSFAKSGDIRVPWKNRPEVEEKAGVECSYAILRVVASGNVWWELARMRSIHDRPTGLIGSENDSLHAALDPLVRQALDASPGVVTAPIPLVASYGNERAFVDVPQRERDFNREFHRFGGLDRSLSATTRFKTVFEWFRVMEDEERRERERRKDFTFLLPELEWVRRAVAKAELRCKNPRVETKPVRMLVDFDHENGETEPLDISALSDGYRTHFSLVIDVARRMVQLNPSSDLDDRERGTNTRAVVLIDEVDLHLDPSWQGRVIRGLRSAFPNTQFVVTTHSEQVLGSVGAECVRKLIWDNGEIVIENVPFAQGATGERILVDLMGAPERVPGPITDKLKAYLKLVERGEGNREDAEELRAELEGALQHDPMLHQAQLDMKRQEIMAKFGGKAG